jgi:hypothetical protein
MDLSRPDLPLPSRLACRPHHREHDLLSPPDKTPTNPRRPRRKSKAPSPLIAQRLL